jgi:peptidoglycan/xylan/chitin deacetylase (PgdA/CDA1 family)
MSIKESIINFSAKFQSNNFEKSYPLDYCIPVYHAVSNYHLPHLKNIINYKNEKEFEKDLDILSKNFQFVNWDEFKDFINGTFKPKKKICLLTFDDGLSEFYDVVVPILERKGIYAINFINPKFIDNTDLMYRCKASILMEQVLQSDKRELHVYKDILHHDSFKKLLNRKINKIDYYERKKLDLIEKTFKANYQDYLIDFKPYMTLDQLKTVTEKGFGISSHGFDHPLYHQLNLDEQIENTLQSYEYLKKNNFISESFAFPFTDYGVKREFFEEIFSTQNLFCSFGSAGLKKDSFTKNLQRIPMENGKDANQILKEEIAYFNLKKLLNKNTIHRK